MLIDLLPITTILANTNIYSIKRTIPETNPNSSIRIAKIKSKIERKYEKLGSLTYLNYKNGDDENASAFNSKVEKICGEIEELFSILRKTEQEYSEIKEKPTYL